MTLFRSLTASRIAPLLGGVAAAWAGLLTLTHPALAQGKLDARYEATLAGILVGKGSWTIDISDDQYTAAASGGTSGLLKTFASGSGTGAAQGHVVNGALVPMNYQASTTTQKKSESIRMALTGGNVKDFAIEPEPPVDSDRIPVTDAHRRGVFDPMTGSMLRVPGTTELLSPEACRTGEGIFDGRMRYDLKLDFKRMETVKAEKAIRDPCWFVPYISRQYRAIFRIDPSSNISPPSAISRSLSRRCRARGCWCRFAWSFQRPSVRRCWKRPSSSPRQCRRASPKPISLRP